jgi:carboxylesterase
VVRVHDIPGGTVVRETARPVFLRGGTSAALLLHGFTGTPRELTPLGSTLHAAGFTVSIPRLPGHGTNGADFAQTGWRDWLGACTDAYRELRSAAARIFLAGLSMGGLLAVMLASRFPFERIALAAPALRTRNPLIRLAPVLSPLVRRLPASHAEQYEDADEQFMADEYWRWRFPGPLAELLRLQRMAVRALPQVEADTLTLIGSEDQTVPLSVLGLVESRVGARRTEHLVLQGCGHRIFRENCRDAACAEIVRWFTGNGRKGDS